MSKFNIGDWVQFVDADGTRYFGKCTDIRDTYHSDYGDITVVDTDVGYFIQDIEYWQPKQGEWCWFRDSSGGANLKRFDQMCPIVPTNYVSKEGLISGTVEPFIGQLPSFLKGVKNV